MDLVYLSGKGWWSGDACENFLYGDKERVWFNWRSDLESREVRLLFWVIVMLSKG